MGSGSARGRLVQARAIAEGRAAAEREAAAARAAAEAAAAAAAAGGAAVAQHRNAFLNVLNMACPRCGMVFVDFDGCCALACRRPGCRANFCAYCLEDCGRDAHPHVRRCPHGYGWFPSQQEFDAAQVWRRERALIAFLDGHIGPNARARRELVALVDRDLRDLGIDPNRVLGIDPNRVQQPVGIFAAARRAQRALAAFVELFARRGVVESVALCVAVFCVPLIAQYCAQLWRTPPPLPAMFRALGGDDVLDSRWD